MADRSTGFTGQEAALGCTRLYSAVLDSVGCTRLHWAVLSYIGLKWGSRWSRWFR